MLLAVVDLTGVVELWMLYVIMFVFGLALAVDNPTRQSFVPELVPAPELPERDRAEQRDLPGGADPRVPRWPAC